MTRPFEGNRSIIPVGAPRIFISSTLPVSVVECVFITPDIGDCFTVIPIAMTGNHYSFAIATSIFSGILTAYFLPTHTDLHINITVITKEGMQRISRFSQFDRGSMIYAYNSSITKPFIVYISSSSPFAVLLTMRTILTKIPSESFACTMLTPLPDKAYSQIELRDDFDVHFISLEPSKDYRTQLFVSAPMQNCQPFTVVTFRRNNTKLINIKPNMISDDIAMKWDHYTNDAVIGYSSNNIFFQLLRFETYRNLYSFLDIVPAYSQFLTGRLCFLFKNESERLFLYDISRQLDSFLLDGETIDIEYMQNFDNPFRYITMRKISTKKLGRGLHCLQSKGPYPVETLKWVKKSDPSLYRQDTFGISFVTLFPWMTTENAADNMNVAFTLDILNPHPYMVAAVKISYQYELQENLIETTYFIKPYTHRKLKMNKTLMTKFHDAHNDGIYKSSYDSRIMITSSIPISVTQNCFVENKIGDSFAVLPIKMAGQKYSFSVPKSIANNSHAIIYFLPVNQTTKLSIVTKVNGKETFYNIEIKMEKNFSIFAYFGSGEELMMNLLSDNPFQVIIAFQRLLIYDFTPDIERRIDFGCTMAIPVPQNEAVHHIMQIFFPRKSTFSDQQQLTFKPATMQHYFHLPAKNFSDFSTIRCKKDYIQIYAFGSSNLEGNYIDFVPSTSQYVTGRSHFVTYHYQNWVLIFMDEYAINDIEMNGVFIAKDYIYEIPSPDNLAYFALQTVHSTVRIHYVQSTGRYVVHVLSDTIENEHMNIAKEERQNSFTKPASQSLSTKVYLKKYI
ncbi:hypothetical protein DINM_005476 [Dirofilaria immitis]|nr:hypothetical protein [Dirofilaria immitis]